MMTGTLTLDVTFVHRTQSQSNPRCTSVTSYSSVLFYQRRVIYTSSQLGTNVRDCL